MADPADVGHARARAVGERVVLDLTAEDADRIVWALERHAQRGTFFASEYQALGEEIALAVDATQVDLGPGLNIVMVPK